MQGTPRPTPGLLKTLETIISVVRQSHEANGEDAPKQKVEVRELLDLFKGDLGGQRTTKRSTLSVEQQEADDLTRIRAALYSQD
ncbi:hypothetical protein [Pelagovum pacificum]|nr:hypothetical protein [Pelagovum pacificum]QQA41341.1 hypothetical protein I8N54_10915 [Pelagovum pacificum]